MSHLKYNEYLSKDGLLMSVTCKSGTIITADDPQMFVFAAVDGDNDDDDEWRLLFFKLEIS